MSQKIKDEEIDFIETLIIIWKNKWKVLIITLLTVLAMFAYQKSIKNEVGFEATTEILPLSYFDEKSYKTYNSYSKNLYDQKYISSSYLINKYILLSAFEDILNEKTLFISAAKQSNLVNKESYENNKKYEEAIKKLVSSIEIKGPKLDGAGKIAENLSIRVEIENPKNWKKFLLSLQDIANYEVQIFLKKNFENYIFNENKLNTFAIKDMDDLIFSSFEYHDLKILNRLAFLNEQAKIARSLNIDKYKPGTELRYESYYFRGYEAIEKEIELIQNRKDKKVFIDEYASLERKRSDLINNHKVKRLENLFKSTPIVMSQKFKAARIMIDSTIYKSKGNVLNKTRLFMISIIVGLLSGTLFVLILNAIQKRK